MVEVNIYIDGEVVLPWDPSV